MAANIAVSAASVYMLEQKGQLQGCATEQGYRQSMRLMQSMRDTYAGADLAKASLEWDKEDEEEQDKGRVEASNKAEEDYLVADQDWLKDLEAATCWYVAEPFRADSFLQYSGEGLDVFNDFFAY